MKPIFIFILFLIPTLNCFSQEPTTLNNTLKEIKNSESNNTISLTKFEMLNDIGITLGFRGGKAERSYELIRALEKRSDYLDNLFNFKTLISDSGWLPPVITEAQGITHITDDQIRTSSIVYEIIIKERFVSNPPTWRKWLFMGLNSYFDNQIDVVIENSEQRKIFENAVKKGWIEGRKNADLIIESNFNRLIRDYKGMLIYSLLLQKNMISLPIVKEKQQTVTISDNKLIIVDKVKQLTEKAQFDFDKKNWKPIIKTQQK